MARPTKKGLDYFPFDVDFFEDEKIAAISGEFGLKGEIVAVKLLCAIYRNGYFILWSDMLRLKILRDLPGVSPDLLDKIVNRLVRWEFFDKALFDSVGVLTSRGIQKRYLSVAKRRTGTEEMPYLLVSVDRNPLQSELLSTETPQRKVKESKENNKPSIIPLCGGDRESLFPEEPGSAIHDDCTEDAAISEADASAVKNTGSRRFTPPNIEEVAAYCKKRQNGIDPQSFIDHYSAVGWMVGRNRMKDWQAAVRTWENRRKKDQSHHNSAMDYKIPL